MASIGNACIIIVTASFAVSAQRPGGEIRKRLDAKGREYFEVFADAINGNHAAPAPMRLAGSRPQWPKSVSIRAEGTWKTGPGAEGPLDAAGQGGGTCPGCPAPLLPWGALVARWVKLDTAKPPNPFAASLPVEPFSPWFRVGTSVSIEVPIQIAAPRPSKPAWLSLYPGLDAGPELNYTPLIALQYQCNDTDFSDNDGWLHVYQEWMW